MTRFTSGLFLLALGDHNRLVLADVDRSESLAEWDFSEAQGTVQFLSAVPGGPREIHQSQRLGARGLRRV
jgi:hypothetical protein